MEEILWTYSWPNIIMLINAIPKYKDEKKTTPNGDEIIEVTDFSQLGF